MFSAVMFSGVGAVMFSGVGVVAFSGVVTFSGVGAVMFSSVMFVRVRARVGDEPWLSARSVQAIFQWYVLFGSGGEVKVVFVLFVAGIGRGLSICGVDK